MIVYTDKELKDALLRALIGSENYTNAYNRMSHMVLQDINSAVSRARDTLREIGLSEADIRKVISLVKKRF